MVQCMVCRFGNHPSPSKSAAFVLLFGQVTTEQAWNATVQRALVTSVPSVAVYCDKCRCIRAMTDQENATQALVQHELDWNAWNLKSC